MGSIGCVRCKKFLHDFVARTFALIAPVWPILHRVLCCNQMVQNTSKMYETHHNISFGYNGVDRVDSLQKNPMWIRGTNFCINCSSSARFKPSFMNNETIKNAPEHYKTHQYMSLGSNGVDRVCSFWKILKRLNGTNLCFNCTISNCFAPSFDY